MLQVTVERHAMYGAPRGWPDERVVRIPFWRPDQGVALIGLLEETFRLGQNDFQPQKNPSVSVGDVASLAFDPNEPVTTALTVKVPADAKVFLAGKQTTLTGEQRKFTTTRLPLGQQWANYAIRVEVDRDGQTLAKEEKISLQAGDSREVTFDFPATTVARVAER